MRWPTSNEIADIRPSKIYKIWTPSTGIFTATQEIYLKKHFISFFRKRHRNKLKQNTYSKIAVVHEYLKFPYNEVNSQDPSKL